MYTIMKKVSLNPQVTMMEIHAPLVAAKAQAGQFVIFRVDELGERIPLTIADYSREKGSVTIIFQQVGRSTRMLSELDVGQKIFDFVGPLGAPTNTGDAKNICVIGGGVGCAIAYPQSKTAYHNGCEVTTICGFRNRDMVILEEEMKQVAHHAFLMTDDGSCGEQGFVTEKLLDLIRDGSRYDLVVAIGPAPMMKRISDLTREYGIRTIVSLNPIMVDGTGMCGGCRVTVGGEIRFACVDGPDFDGHLVDFDELILRNSAYRGQEICDAETCRLLGGKTREIA